MDISIVIWQFSYSQCQCGIFGRRLNWYQTLNQTFHINDVIFSLVVKNCCYGSQFGLHVTLRELWFKLLSLTYNQWLIYHWYHSVWTVLTHRLYHSPLFYWLADDFYARNKRSFPYYVKREILSFNISFTCFHWRGIRNMSNNGSACKSKTYCWWLGINWNLTWNKVAGKACIWENLTIRVL